MIDDHGYPTDEFLDWIRMEQNIPLLLDRIEDAWTYGFNFKRKYDGIRTLELTTGGWSGNEELIAAMMSSILRVYWHESRRGGYHRFVFPVNHLI